MIVQIVSTNKDILTNQYYYWLIVSRSMKLKGIWLTYYIHEQVEDLKEIFKWSRHGEFTIQLIKKISDCNIIGNNVVGQVYLLGEREGQKRR